MAAPRTALAAQLVPTHLSQARRSQYPTLIYDQAEAGDISISTVHQAALEVSNRTLPSSLRIPRTAIAPPRPPFQRAYGGWIKAPARMY